MSPAHDPVNHPTHYTSHPSGVECIEVVEWFPANLANAWKYLHRHDLKGSSAQDIRKAQWYVLREIRRRRILSRRKQQPEAYAPVALPRLVSRYLRHEDGPRREIFGNLWNAFRSPLGLENLKTAERRLGGLLLTAAPDNQGTTK